MRAIYETKGRSKEYCELALNLYIGCEHRCIYCYVPMILRKSREEFGYRAIPRWEIFDQLRKEVHKYKGKTVFLCFTCDPYQLEINYITNEALQILLPAGVNVEILTKAGGRSTQDFYLFKQYKDQINYGATLTFTDSEISKKYEPFAADPRQRIEVLHEAKKIGLRTWVSLEPVIDPKQTLMLIDCTWDFVDEYRVGKLNYFPLPMPVDWSAFLIQAIRKFKLYGKKYLIKDSLKPYLKEGL